MLLSEITNGTFESVTSASGSTPSYGYDVNNWTFSLGASTSSTEWGCGRYSNDYSIYPPILYGLEPASGDYSLITIGNYNASWGDSTPVIATNTTGNLGTIGGNVIFKFSNYAWDTENEGVALNYELRYTFKVGLYYWDNDNQTWTTVANSGRNTIVGSVAEEWIENTVTMSQPPVAGALELKFFRSRESGYEEATFRMYFDNIIIIPESKLEYYSTNVTIEKTEYKDNSGVLKTFDNRFGQLSDIIYSNTLVNSSGTAITSYSYFGSDIISESMNLETMINTLRLNDLALANDRFEGTFRKVNNTAINPSGTNRVNALTPIDMITKPKMNFSTLTGLDNELAIDRMIFNITKNRYELVTHTPKNISYETPLTQNTDVKWNRNFYEFKPSQK